MRHPVHQPEPKILRPHLDRSISLAEATVYGLGIIFGAGIYALIGEAAGIAGNSMWFSFVIAATVASFTALSYCELSSMFPRSAAEYMYVKNAFNSNLLGFLMGWVSTFAAIVSISAVSLGFAGYFSGLFGTPVVLAAVSLIAILTIVNFLGVKESARLNLVLTIVATLGLVLIILMAIPFFGSVNYLMSTSPFMPFEGVMNNVAIAAALIFFAYIGFEDIANISEETVNARNAIPKAILVALMVSTLLYVLVSISVVSIVPWDQLAGSSAPIALVGEAILGPLGGTFFSFIALFATASTVLIILVAVSRLLYGMSIDHSLPKLIASIHSRNQTPYVSITITSVIAMLFVLGGNLKQVAFITNFGIFVLFFMVNLSVIVMRFTKPKMKRVYRIPVNVGRVPLTALFGVISTGFMISKVEPDAIAFGLFAIIIGIPLFYVLTRIR